MPVETKSSCHEVISQDGVKRVNCCTWSVNDTFGGCCQPINTSSSNSFIGGGKNEVRFASNLAGIVGGCCESVISKYSSPNTSSGYYNCSPTQKDKSFAQKAFSDLPNRIAINKGEQKWIDGADWLTDEQKAGIVSHENFYSLSTEHDVTLPDTYFIFYILESPLPFYNKKNIISVFDADQDACILKAREALARIPKEYLREIK